MFVCCVMLEWTAVLFVDDARMACKPGYCAILCWTVCHFILLCQAMLQTLCDARMDCRTDHYVVSGWTACLIIV